MRTNRRKFIGTALAGGVAATLPGSCDGSESKRADYARLDEILKKPVLKKELFVRPVIIKSLELLRYKHNFLCRVRSSDGAEGREMEEDMFMGPAQHQNAPNEE